MKTRWSATVAKDGDAWKLVNVHFSANAFDNPMLDAAKAYAQKMAIIAGVVGLDRRRIADGAAAAASARLAPEERRPRMLDLLLKGGLVFDGTGAPPTRADVGIAGGRIARIAPVIDEAARATRDVGGLWIAPGFVDIHTHYDVEVEIAPGLAESVRHGVTTVVMGNCSLSVTVGDPQALADIFLRVENLPAPLVRRWLARAVSWDSPQAYLAHLRTLPLGPNVAPLVGHSALRAAVMGLERSLHARATDDEIARMRALAGEALDAGCIGISVDMVHWHKVSGVFAGRSVPSHYADAREYRMLADVCRVRDAVFQVTPNPQNPLSFLLILGMATGLFRPPLRATVLSALDMSDHPHLWRLFPAVTFVVNRLLGGNLRFQTLAEPFAIYADGPITPLFEEFAAGVELNSRANRDARRALWTSDGLQGAVPGGLGAARAAHVPPGPGAHARRRVARARARRTHGGGDRRGARHRRDHGADRPARDPRRRAALGRLRRERAGRRPRAPDGASAHPPGVQRRGRAFAQPRVLRRCARGAAPVGRRPASSRRNARSRA